MPVRVVDNFTGGYNDRNSWTLFEPGKAKAIYATSEAEAQAEAAKIINPIVIPPSSTLGSNFVASTAKPVVDLNPPPAVATLPGLPSPSEGRIIATAVPIKGGCRISVAGFHTSVGEKMNCFLDVKINREYYPVMQVLAGQVVNANSNHSLVTLDISYDAINKVFAANGKPELKVAEGTGMAVVAAFPSGHQWGLAQWNRGSGEFIAPKPL